MKWLDAFSENSARTLARRTSRRSVLAGLGSLLLGAASVPLLPVARGADAKPAGGASKADPGDPQS
jgi:methylamine dehydrogenase light chain